MTYSNLYLKLAAEFSGHEVTYANTSDSILDHVNKLLIKFSRELGKVINIQATSRTVAKSFEDYTHIITLGNYQLSLQLINFVPAKRWELKSFRLTAIANNQ